MAGRKTFLLGQAVALADGVVGRLEGLEMQPDWIPTHLLVLVPRPWPWQRGRLLRLPAQAATGFRTDDIVVSTPSSEGETIAHAGASHAEGEVRWLNSKSRFQIATRAVERQSADFSGLIVAPNGSVHLAGEMGTLAPRRILVPVEAALYQNHEFVWVDLKGQSLDTIPTYEPEESVEGEA